MVVMGTMFGVNEKAKLGLSQSSGHGKQNGHNGSPSLREVPQSWSSGSEGVIGTLIQSPLGPGLAISTVRPLRFHHSP